MSAASLGVAVVGLGVGEQHARAYAADRRVSSVRLYDVDLARSEALAAALPGTQSARSFEQLLDDPGANIISIASYDDAHADQIVAALERGKHVFVEKPLCTTEEDLARIAAAWRGAGGRLKLGGNLVLRSAPLYQWLRDKVSRTEFGELYAFDGDYLYGRLRKITEGWRGRRGHYSVMLGGGIHLVDLMLWITGQRPRAASARGNRISTQASAFQDADFVAATLEFDSGLVARITANFGCVMPHQHSMRIFGTQETFIYDDAGPRLHSSRDPGARAKPIDKAPLPRTKGELIPEFLDAVSGKIDYAAHTRSLLDGISVCLASERAAVSGRSEEIRYV